MARIATDIQVNLWGVHTGRLFPWAHLRGVPLYSTTGLVIEWLMLAIAGLGLATGVRRSVAARLGLVVIFVGLTQRYSNHRALLAIALLFVALRPVDCENAPLLLERHPNIALLRYQLVIVYLFSALNKLAHGFMDGHVLTVLFGIAPPLAQPLAWLFVLAELATPLLLWRAPRAGLALAFVLHVGFAALMPALWPFTITMLALAMLFQRGAAPTIQPAG
jgi:hypothetical protein